MPITLYIDGCSEDIAFTAAADQGLIALNLDAMGYNDGNPCPVVFAAGRYICSLSNPGNRGLLYMTFYNPLINKDKANILLDFFSSDEHLDLLMDAYNEVNSKSYACKDKYVFEFVQLKLPLPTGELQQYPSHILDLFQKLGILHHLA